MNIGKAIGYYLHNLAYLKKSEHPSRMKGRIFWTYVRLNTKCFFISRLWNSKKDENVFGFKVSAFHYGDIRFFFEEIFLRNEYYFKASNRQPVIFDCGANIGMATLYFKWLYPKSTVYAFEPDRETFQVLKKNVEKNKLSDVHLFNLALSDREGTIDFFYDRAQPGNYAMSTKRERMPKDKTTVPCTPLSPFIGAKKVDFLKMDIEGAEEEVIGELSSSRKLDSVREGIIEYHHRISGHPSRLGSFLALLEKDGFEYQVGGENFQEKRFQNVMVHFYREP